MTKILVIDDEQILREEMVEWLTLEGYEASGASDGMEGVKQAIKYHPDLIISDITMPRLDGYGVLLELSANSRTATIPFIFVTARAAHEDVRRGMELGADDYITKPFSRTELLHAVQTRLGKKTVQEKHHQFAVSQLQQAFEHEREQRMLKAKLIAMFSHDFRTPLTTILSSNSLLRDYSDRMDDERRAKHYSRIDASVFQLIQMLDDMMIVSQMETGNFNFNPQPLVIGDYLKRIIEDFQSIHFDTHQLVLKGNFNAEIQADPTLLKQIVANLISNAVKYSPDSDTVNIILDYTDQFAVIAVQDYGIGIPEEEQEHLFNAFQRASNVGDIEGTGLGLEIVKQAVQLHDGAIDLKSQVDVGTTISVMIPL